MKAFMNRRAWWIGCSLIIAGCRHQSPAHTSPGLDGSAAGPSPTADASTGDLTGPSGDGAADLAVWLDAAGRSDGTSDAGDAIPDGAMAVGDGAVADARADAALSPADAAADSATTLPGPDAPGQQACGAPGVLLQTRTQ